MDRKYSDCVPHRTVKGKEDENHLDSRRSLAPVLPVHGPARGRSNSELDGLCFGAVPGDHRVRGTSMDRPDLKVTTSTRDAVKAPWPFPKLPEHIQTLPKLF